jgi:ketosteroid isomerase-like protein
MSLENLDTVRRVYDAAARGDTESVLSLYDPGIEWDFTRGGLGGLVGNQVYRGYDGMRQFFRAWYDAWEHLDDIPEQLIDAGYHVVSVSNVRGRGRVSGLEVELKGQVGVWTIREGRVVRVVWFGRPDLEVAPLGG